MSDRNPRRHRAGRNDQLQGWRTNDRRRTRHWRPSGARRHRPRRQTFYVRLSFAAVIQRLWACLPYLSARKSLLLTYQHLKIQHYDRHHYENERRAVLELWDAYRAPLARMDPFI